MIQKLILLFCITIYAGAYSSAQIIASQDFNTLNAVNLTTDQVTSGNQLTNSGSFNIGGAGLDFSSTWFDTRGEGTGPVVGGESSDFIGVNFFSGASAPDVSSSGTPVADGVEQNFEFNDPDGAVVLRFESVDISTYTNRRLTIDYWINDTGFESNDAFTISISNGGLGVVLLGFSEADLEANVETGESDPASWKTLNVDLDAVLSSSGLDPTNIILAISADINAASENIFVDNIVFEAVCSVHTLTANFLPCNDNGTPEPDDDYFIADFTTTFSNVPATGDIQLEVQGQVFSTSVSGLGNLFQFLAVPLSSDGRPVVATISFTANPGCTLTSTVGLAPAPCPIIDPCTELFFSEYIEGSGLNKALEIYNPNESAVDLTSENYVVAVYNNGNPDLYAPNTALALNGNLDGRRVFLLSHEGAGFIDLADQTTNVGWFNGCDAVLLWKEGIGGTIVDAIGRVGEDPGTAWTSVNGVSTLNQTLERMGDVQMGDSNPYDAFDPGVEWINGFPVDNPATARYFASVCGPPIPTISQWGIIILLLIMVIFGVSILNTKKVVMR